MAVRDARVEVGNLLGGGLHFEDDHDVGEDDDAGRQDEAEKKDGHDEALARHGGLGQPPVQCARGAKRFWGVAAPADQGHGGPEGCIHPHQG